MNLKTNCLIATLVISLVAVVDLHAQRGGTQQLPSQRYYAGFADYYQGDYDGAVRLFRTGARTAYKDGHGRFMDSICYWTMTGECYYQMGRYAEAIENYEAAIRLYANFVDWPSRTTFPPQVQADRSAVERAQITWGQSSRQAAIGKFPGSMNVMLGDPNAAARARQQGGLVDPARLRPVDMSEVLRCAALAMHRRRLIKGPTCKHDPLTQQTLAKLSAMPGGNGTISGAWHGVVLGMAQASAGNMDNAIRTLQQSMQYTRFDHPLTPLALLELGYLAKEQRNWQAAQRMFLEASYSGAVFHQYDVIADALHEAAVVQMVAQRDQVFSPLQPAADWARRERAYAMQASVTGDAAWSAAESGAAQEALNILNRNSRSIRRDDLASSRLGDRWLYCSALAHSMVGDTKSANEDLQQFLKAAIDGSKWLYQVALADDLVVNSRVTRREADALYTELLRDPSQMDWLVRPMESISFLISNHIGPMTRWYQVAVELKAESKALEISDLVRRHRFYSALPMGGRQLALRWTLAAPPEAISESTLERQADLLTRFPELDQLGNRSEQLVDQLRQMPVNLERGSDEFRQQKKLVDELRQVSAARELLTQSLALRREPCEMVFPPQSSLQDIQGQLKENQLVLATFYTGDRYYIDLISKNSYSQEAVVPAAVLERLLNDLLEQIGVRDQGGTTTVDQIQNEEWRETAKQISAALLPRTQPQRLDPFDELIVVPDGPLWYFPFELIQVGTPEETMDLFDKIDIRYAPTLSTTIPDRRLPRRFSRSVVFAGKTHVRDREELAQNALGVYREAVPQAESIDRSNRLPSRFLLPLTDQVIVWSEIEHDEAPIMALAPLQYDEGRDSSNLASWMGFPWGELDLLVLPGFKSGADSNRGQGGDGREMFLAACGALASGSKTMLISRWPVGGKSALDFSREFATESQKSRPLDALRRSVNLLKNAELDLAQEPRVRERRLDQPIKGDHPLFWSSYMLIQLAKEREVETEDKPAEVAPEGEEGE